MKYFDKLSIKKLKGTITSPKGFKAAGISAGLKKSGKPDMTLLYSEVPATSAAVFTTNQVKAAPVIVCQQFIKKGLSQAIVVNSGNANCWTGKKGLADALIMIKETAQVLKIHPEYVLVASTGVIGKPMPMPKIKKGIKKLAGALSKSGGNQAARSIMTTDTVLKQIAVKVGKVTIAGMAKGAGMIEPGLATMLGFITTDAAIDKKLLQKLLKQAVSKTFNMVSVDNCMSTNDAVFILANGLSGIWVSGDQGIRDFYKGLKFVCEHLAMEIARDGEGATKFLTVKVNGAKNDQEARVVVKALIGSYLLKAAVYGQDKNLGRIVQAVGATKAKVNWYKFKFDWQMGKKDHVITVDLGQGRGRGRGRGVGWGCDLTEGYVKVNARYHT
ncbi:MAG: bifunctional glutamate N-acetyltransferase/amino-acid acetyltransferase ArgJ [bacterium]